MITIHAADASDFSGLGLGVLTPSSLEIEERTGGLYELSMTHPMDEDGRWWNIAEYCIIKAPAPMRETPLVSVGASATTVTRQVYKVKVNSRLRLRTAPSTSKGKIIGRYKNGTRVIKTDESGDWYKVIVQEGGATGWMHSDYLTYVEDITETIAGDAPGAVVQPRQTREQLFRIISVERDDAMATVSVTAQHIFYDLSGNIVKGTYAPEGIAAAEVCAQLMAKALNPHDFNLYCTATGSVAGEYTDASIVSALLEKDIGVVPQTGARLVRDNYDIFVLADEVRDRGVEIRHGKNLTGAVLTIDTGSVVTRIVPVGRDADGEPLYSEGDGYVDSPRAAEIPVVRAKAIEYDVSVVDKGDANADEGKYATEAEARARLLELAEADFAAGIDSPTVGLDVDFVALENTEEYAQYADLQAIHLYDTVHVYAARSGITAALRMTGYVWDALANGGKGRYKSVTLGDLQELETTTYGYDIAEGTLSGTKVINGTVGGSKLRNASIQYAKISVAAIEQLAANAITAVSAHINQLVAGEIEVDQLYADLATIAAAQITTANIEQANIDWAQIQTLSAQIADIVNANIAQAVIKEAQIEDGSITRAKIADLAVDAARIADAAITSAKIAQAVIQSAHIEDAAVTRAKIALLAVDSARIDDLAVTTAKIHDLAVDTAKIADLAVTAAKIANATITNAQIANATIGTAQIALGAITTALIAQGAVGTAQIADASITDAKIVELSASRITTGTLSVERLIIVGSDKSIVYTINEANGTAQLSQTTIDGGSLTQRSITADRIVAGAITANEIAAATILANNIAAGAITSEKIAAGAVEAAHIQAGAITTNHVSANFGETLDLSSNESIRSIVEGAVNEIEVGAVNLIADSASHLLAADGDNTFWIAADELESGMVHTLSVKEVILAEGTASGVTWEVVDLESGEIHTSGLLEFTYGKQVVRFRLPEAGGNWALLLYAGEKNATTGVVVQFTMIQLEQGSAATSWRAAPSDSEATIGQLQDDLSALDAGMEERVNALIEGMGLSDQYASAEEFLAAVAEIELLRSEMAQTDSDLTLLFSRMLVAEDGISQMFSSFVFGDDDGTPYLDMSASSSSIKMRLTNTRLAFVQNGSELAYFSDNKLYITRLEVIEQISIGTAINGYLDIVTTPTGVGFMWRS